MAVIRRLLLAGALILAGYSAGAAQTAPGNIWRHGTTANIFAGVASSASRTRSIAGGAVGWEVTPWVGLEGRFTWQDRSEDQDAFAAELSAHVNLLRARPVVPFVKGGVGLYRASFGRVLDDVPEFYRRRLAPPDPALRARQTFTDPSFVFGGGVNVYVSRHVAIRPEVEAIMVRRDGRGHVVTAVTVHLAYHFEEHPITPGRR
jgi:hypothetical protein